MIWLRNNKETDGLSSFKSSLKSHRLWVTLYLFCFKISLEHGYIQGKEGG